MDQQLKDKILHYLEAYNAFDVEGMLKHLHQAVVFENISNGEVSLSTEGIDAFRTQAETAKSYFSEREQTVNRWIFSEQEVTVEINYRAVLAMDFPNGMKKGDVLELGGKSIFTFAEGEIIKITDISWYCFW